MPFICIGIESAKHGTATQLPQAEEFIPLVLHDEISLAQQIFLCICIAQ